MIDSKRISVVVNGALGKMGSTVISAVNGAEDMDLVGAVDIKSNKDKISENNLVIESDLEDLLKKSNPDVVVDFTNGESSKIAFHKCISRGISVVSGSTGLSDQDISFIEDLSKQNKVGCLHASNFAIGAILLMHLASIASKYFDYADLLESHHEMKIDAPSGTALSIVKSMLKGKGKDFLSNNTLEETLKNTRGGDIRGINIHSARIPGRVARHEVVFGAQGQTFTLLHDSINRESFMPGVLTGIRHVVSSDRLTIGLDNLLGLK